jgi:glutamate racemase
VLKAVGMQMPAEPLIYVGDQGHVPYGSRPMGEVRSFADGIVRFLLERGTKLIVVACNAASAAALQYLRETHPGIPFVGMEPAVKPAAERTQTGVVGVLATPATFQGALYASVVERFANGVTLMQHTCPGLVQQIEKGALEASDTRSILENALLPMLAKNIDTVVLGCTHYPFVIPLIQGIVGGKVRVIDPAPAVARQVKRVLESRGLRHPAGPKVANRFYTTGTVEQLKRLLPKLLGEADEVDRLYWVGDGSGALHLVQNPAL